MKDELAGLPKSSVHDVPVGRFAPYYLYFTQLTPGCASIAEVGIRVYSKQGGAVSILLANDDFGDVAGLAAMARIEVPAVDADEVAWRRFDVEFRRPVTFTSSLMWFGFHISEGVEVNSRGDGRFLGFVSEEKYDSVPGLGEVQLERAGRKALLQAPAIFFTPA